MKALLLAAGMGTRLRPITNSIPKCLVLVNGRALLDHWICDLLGSGIESIIINTHYLSKQVEEYIASRPYKNKLTLIYEPKLLGTGGSLKVYAKYFDDQSFLFAHADNYCKTSLSSFINAHNHRAKNIDITMMTFKTDNPSSCGIVETNKDGVVIKFHEKKANPPSNIASGAIFIMEPKVAQFVKSFNGNVFDFSKDVIPYYLNAIQIWHNQDYLIDIGTPAALRKANAIYES